jgi:hypothetical protein
VFSSVSRSKIARRFASNAESLGVAALAAEKSSSGLAANASDGGNGRENSRDTNSARVGYSSNNALYIRCAIAF